LIRQGFQGYRCKSSNGGPLEITLTVPLNRGLLRYNAYWWHFWEGGRRVSNGRVERGGGNVGYKKQQKIVSSKFLSYHSWLIFPCLLLNQRYSWQSSTSWLGWRELRSSSFLHLESYFLLFKLLFLLVSG